MTIGASLFLIAVGAVLKFAITATISGVDIGVIGIILMIVGVLGLILGLALVFRSRSDADLVERQTTTYRDDRPRY